MFCVFQERDWDCWSSDEDDDPRSILLRQTMLQLPCNNVAASNTATPVAVFLQSGDGSAQHQQPQLATMVSGTWQHQQQQLSLPSHMSEFGGTQPAVVAGLAIQCRPNTEMLGPSSMPGQQSGEDVLIVYD
jgi:hypothetical protein